MVSFVIVRNYSTQLPLSQRYYSLLVLTIGRLTTLATKTL